MKKLIILFILLLCGCSVKVLDNNNDSIIDTLVNNKITYYNKVGLGYKYYLPNNTNVIDTKEYNEILYSNGNKYYLYIDMTSYYYKNASNYKFNKNTYYYKELDKGCIKIEKKSNDYIIKFYYNYAYIESKVKKEDIKNALIDMSYIINSIKYNDSIIKNIKDNRLLYGKEEYFKLNTPKKKNEQNYLYYKEGKDINDTIFYDIVDTDVLKIIKE